MMTISLNNFFFSISELLLRTHHIKESTKKVNSEKTGKIPKEGCFTSPR